MAGIFVSYRRQDRPIATRFLVAKLDQHYGADQVFHDLADIDIGDNFLDSIRRALDRCAALIAVIGPDWLEGYRERLHREDDPVRLEIGTALKKDVLVLPVLLGSAGMPSPGDLPADLAALHYKNAVPLRSTDFEADINRLIGRLDRIPLLAEAAARARAGGRPEGGTSDANHRTAGERTRPLGGDWQRRPAAASCALEDATTHRRIEFSGDTITLNRALLDRDNAALSSRAHAVLAQQDGHWTLRNSSSNGATFAQVSGDCPLEDHDTLLLGSAVFEFRVGTEAADGSRAATVALEQLRPYEQPPAASPGFRLVTAAGEPLSFEQDDVLITRDAVAPGNTSISRHRHARVFQRNDQWFITDLSSNRATFLRARRAMPLTGGSALVLGNRLYTFHPLPGP
jgi:hypothetical protein